MEIATDYAYLSLMYRIFRIYKKSDIPARDQYI